ncbi:aminotransferase class III-fold pyridoxal phosphate-dependent enzyme [Agrobacterium rhizogenes]|nr:aminotransferase class III-fold pyridoxal phosphate-dependent enzyme [Rhizobium rhizogenes]ACM30405.1 aminotransferase protein [Rhizobium rhizogenes K84]OCJ16130.1 4-aminobutyrate aminotransferase [Agrobacterium sp. B131/95]MDJ1633872.1 aminotransferase class III-fold pyridoxal phosphate-dependent enzyme [Rhizobium rhizogenes]NTF58740.1 aminotransferase class III-fold pyridoxal phosphate-dependent enzyme [Rhizobium rhizogenes]NTF65219.1 aminotransferase class III-fold pyridoxal phosphate-de
MINGFDASRLATLPERERRMVERRQALLGPSYRLFYDNPLHVVRAEGVWLYDADGEAHLDVYNNVPSVGHCHPRVVEAIARQAAVLNTHTRYLDDTILDYSERLLATFPDEIERVMYTCTGSEAVDLALRIARYYTGGTGIIITENAYHGVTAAAVEISPSLGSGVPLGPHVITVPAPDAYRAEGRDVADALAEDVSKAIAFMRRHGIRPAAFIADSIFSTDGILPDPAGFLQKTLDVVHEAGALYIADEVQPGFGRTGSHMWGFMRHGIVPDIVVMGKPMGNGMPIAAAVMKAEIQERFGKDVRYFNTFGANHVSIAAASAVLDIIRDEKLMENAATTGEHMLAGMRTLQGKFACIGDVRGAGLFLGLEFVKDRDSRTPDSALALAVVNGLRDRRVLISAAGIHGNVLKIRPPLPFSRKHADIFLETLESVLTDIV